MNKFFRTFGLKSFIGNSANSAMMQQARLSLMRLRSLLGSQRQKTINQKTERSLEVKPTESSLEVNQKPRRYWSIFE